MKRIGMICRMDNSGLGTLSWEFARHLRPSKILLVENGVFTTFPERYKEFSTRRIHAMSTIKIEDMDWFFKDIDIILSFETFYNWGIVLMAKRVGVKTVLITMFEMTPEILPAKPDLFICPSPLDYEIMPEPKVHLSVPINTKLLPWKGRRRAKIFTHIASHGGANNRKGTPILIEAMKYVKSDISVYIYTWKKFTCEDPRVKILIQQFREYWQCWQWGDVLIYPQDYNGICLPVMEAFASGMGVVSTNIYPFNEYLPKKLLFNPRAMTRLRAGGNLVEVDAAVISPVDVARKIDEVANMDISKYSLMGKEWAEKNSWEALLPKYHEVFENL